jgi:hypothetical protein
MLLNARVTPLSAIRYEHGPLYWFWTYTRLVQAGHHVVWRQSDERHIKRPVLGANSNRLGWLEGALWRRELVQLAGISILPGWLLADPAEMLIGNVAGADMDRPLSGPVGLAVAVVLADPLAHLAAIVDTSRALVGRHDHWRRLSGRWRGAGWCQRRDRVLCHQPPFSAWSDSIKASWSGAGQSPESSNSSYSASICSRSSASSTGTVSSGAGAPPAIGAGAA